MEEKYEKERGAEKRWSFKLLDCESLSLPMSMAWKLVKDPVKDKLWCTDIFIIYACINFWQILGSIRYVVLRFPSVIGT